MDLSSAINVIESVAGFTDADTAVGEAWAVVTTQLKAAPVPVSERLPRPEDCNEMGQCWWFDAEVWCLDIYDHEYTHWLPATALPLPSSTSPNEAND